MLNYDTPSHFETLSDHSVDQLEYASSVWDPYLKKDIKAVERVQKFAIKIGTVVTTICSMSTSPTLYSIQETATPALSLSFS